MGEVPPATLAALTSAPGEVGELFRSFFGEFDFDGIRLTLPTRTFEGRLSLDVGGREVELIEVGPAHTRGTCSWSCPTPGRCSPATSSSSVASRSCGPGRWRTGSRACDLMLGLDVDVVVPGHGPVTDKAGVAAVRDYLVFVDREATGRHAAGLDAWTAAREIAALIGADGTFGALE